MPSREKTIKRAVKILLDSSRHETIISLLILIIRSFLPLIAIFLIRYYIDRLTGEQKADSLSGRFNYRSYHSDGLYTSY